ncbi:MAG: hypothetical protein ACLP66_10315 [Polyangia bacterium]
MTDRERLQAVYHEYESQLGKPGTLRDAVDWGLANGKLSEPQIDPKRLLIRNMGGALRSETSIDACGREYRVNAAVTYTKTGGVQESLWGSVDLQTTPREFVSEHFQQRRKGIVDTCVRLKADVDHYNDAHPRMEQLPLILDFADDVAEREAVRDRWRAEDYPDPHGEEDDDEDDPSDPYPTEPSSLC